MDFAYTAKSRTGQTTEGTIDAASVADARQQLRSQGMFPLTVFAGTARKKKTGGNGLLGRKRRVSKRDLLMLTAQLSIMCRTGLDMAEALKSLAKQATNPTLRSVMEEVYGDVSSGQPISIALSRHPKVFDTAYVASIAAAEASGKMTEILSRLTELMRNEIRLHSSLRSTLAYPVILVSVASVVIMALVFFVLPQFATIFEDMDAPTPPLTHMLLTGAQFLRENIIMVLLSAGAALIGLILLFRTETVKRVRDRLVLNLRGLRGATRSLLSGRAFRIMGTMLESGIPLLEAIRLCGSSFKNRLYRELFVRLETEVVNGAGIGDTLAATAFVPSGVAQMVATAEQTGQLGSVMETVGEFYEDDGERRLRQLITVMEPAIIVAMGGVVACVVLSVVLPLLDVSQMAGQR
ncbi:MAG: type II secretion system F family protein [Pirellulaceae bacterium]|nr:type II secretion system F family protein [Pirellulaceae bacterium]